ncbi:AP-4 complex accessory subunit RUSC1 isoform X2 [Nycticebus coucang]|uniref:AP-4 complex accessory subunit RUSC1 isoform X2 n=1 Tax=Nycticebus coucang TaxID=9470 RepID=UPI00234CC1DE|nr:AP-4 complex accessory subunit RUSC1 isoform X2 [Nycticebus coucang]
MLSPQRALLCNLNHIHLQHVSLGLHLSRRPELREGPLSTSPPPGDTGGKESRGPCSGTLVDANSNSPAVPCRCCQDHGSSLENRLDPSREEEGAASPSDPGCSSSLSSCSDLSPDESPVSVYSRNLPGDDEAHLQSSIIPLEQGSPLASAGPGACSPDSFCCSPDSCSGASSPPGSGLDSNCNALTTCQDLPSPSLEEEDESGEQDLPTSELLEVDDGKIDAGKTEPSWKINPIWKIDTEKTEGGWKTTENDNRSWEINENTNSSWKNESGKFNSGWKTNTGINDSGSKTDSGKIDGGWRSDVSEEPVPHRTITSFHELAQKRKRGPGLPLLPQAKKDRSDWLIVFSPDTELPPTGSLGSSCAPTREVTTFKELRSRSRAPPPPVPPRDPPAGWALVPPRPPPPPIPPRRKKNRPGLQPIAEGLPDEGRAGSPAAGEEAPAAKEPEEVGAQAGVAAGLLRPRRPRVFRLSAHGRPLAAGGAARAAASLHLAPPAGPRTRLRGPHLPVRQSPVGAYSPPPRGALPCLAGPELALLLSPLFPRSSTFPATAPPPRQVPAPPLPPPPRPPKAPRWTRSPPPPPRLRKTDGARLPPSPPRSLPPSPSSVYAQSELPGSGGSRQVRWSSWGAGLLCLPRARPPGPHTPGCSSVHPQNAESVGPSESVIRHLGSRPLWESLVSAGLASPCSGRAQAELPGIQGARGQAVPSARPLWVRGSLRARLRGASVFPSKGFRASRPWGLASRSIYSFPSVCPLVQAPTCSSGLRGQGGVGAPGVPLPLSGRLVSLSPCLGATRSKGPAVPSVGLLRPRSSWFLVVRRCPRGSANVDGRSPERDWPATGAEERSPGRRQCLGGQNHLTFRGCAELGSEGPVGGQSAEPGCGAFGADHPLPCASCPGGRWAEAFSEGPHHRAAQEQPLERGGGVGEARLGQPCPRSPVQPGQPPGPAEQQPQSLPRLYLGPPQH